MAFQKNWHQFVVSKGEPFKIEFLDRKFGGRAETVFEVTEEGVVQVNGQVMDGDQNIVGSLTASTTITGADLVATDDLTVGGDAAITGALTVTGDLVLDDLTVGDDAAIGGDLAVTGALTVTDTSEFTGAVTLPADTVTAENLALALAAQIPMTATLTVGALVGDGREVTIQVKDVAGVNMALVGRYNVWLSDTAKGTPIGQVTTGLTTTITAGTTALVKLANMDYEILSTALGALAVTVTDTNGTQTRYVNIAINGVVYASAAVVTT